MFSATAISGGGSAVGSVTSQVTEGVLNGDNLTTAVANVDGEKVAISGAVGALSQITIGVGTEALKSFAANSFSQVANGAINNTAAALSTVSPVLPLAAQETQMIATQAAGAIAAAAKAQSTVIERTVTAVSVATQTAENLAADATDEELKKRRQP